MDDTPVSALEYVRNGRKVLVEGLRFPLSTAKELNKHGILSEEELCAIRGLSEGADRSSKLLDMVIAKGEQACCVLRKILQNIPEGKVKDLLQVQSLSAPQHSPEEDFYPMVSWHTNDQLLHRMKDRMVQEGSSSAVWQQRKETAAAEDSWLANISHGHQQTIMEEGSFLQAISPYRVFSRLTRTSLPRLIGNDLHLNVMEDEDEDVFEEAGAIMMQHPKKIQLYLHVNQDFQHLGEALKSMIFKCLPRIKRIRLHRPIDNFVLQLFLQAAQNEVQTGQKTVMLLTDVIDFNTIFDEIVYHRKTSQRHTEFLLDLFSHIKAFETETGQSVQPLLNPVYQSAPAVWDIDLSKRKASILLEVLKFQTDKKPVNIINWSDEENERWSFLQCLPYISQLGLDEWHFNSNKAIRFIANLFIQAAECDRETGEKKLQLLLSVCSYSSFPALDDKILSLISQSDFLLDLYSLLTDCENPSRKHVLQALQPVYQSAPAGWVIDLSKRKASILLGVLELQTVKKPAKLVGWSDEENEQRRLLQCLPYVSELHVSKPLLQQLLCLISVGDEVQVTRQAAILSRVLGRTVDLSHIQIDPQTCVSLAAVLEQAEGLSELDLSHCQLNDHSVDLLLPHLHKARVLDLSNNEISDLGALRIHSAVSASSYIQRVRLINNRITDTATFLTDPRYDLWDQSKDQITVEFRPDLNHHNDELSYSFSCESGGQFQCSETGLVFLMKAAGKVEYSPAYWDEAALKTAGYEPAGPLFNIEDPERGLCSLQLPHCEADVEGRDHLSVAHFCGGNMEVLKPLAVTDTHVTIHVQNLSFYGLLRNIFSLITPSVRGQVLLFHPPGSPPQKQVYMFLLPSNVPVSQVENWHHKCRRISTIADCMFIVNQKYSVTSDLKDHEIQPKSWVFYCKHENFHQTFEVFFSHGITEMTLAILDDSQHEVWTSKILLPAEAPDSNQTGDADFCGALEREVNPGEAGEKGGASGYMINGEHFVDRHWGDLINRVGLVSPVLDYLLQSKFLKHEMYSSIFNEKNPCDQMRILMLRVIMPGGIRAKDELCRILETQQKCLMEDLKGE